jgi:alkylation response protein AidB-like acyl-CoA dehydrogenase
MGSGRFYNHGPAPDEGPHLKDAPMLRNAPRPFDFDLGETADMLRDTVFAFSQEEIAPRAAEIDRTDQFPMDLWEKMGGLGLLGITVEEDYGGSGLGYLEHCIAVEEISRASASVGLSYGAHSNLCVNQIRKNGSEAQKRRYLPKLISGQHVGALAMSEPGAGSDVVSMKLRAEKKGDRYVLNGTKMWITNGTFADVALVWACTEEGVRGFLVDTDRRGFQAREVHHKLSLRASNTAELYLEDCRVPDSAVLPGVKGMRGPLSCLSEARFGIAWGVLGAAMSCYETALEYAKVRTQFNRPIAGFQLTQAKLVDMLTGITQGQLVAWQLARLKDAHQARPAQISLAKRANVAMALGVARSARSVMGANGISLEYPVIRHMANLETVYTYEGTHEVHTLTVGKDITGLDAFGG